MKRLIFLTVLAILLVPFVYAQAEALTPEEEQRIHEEMEREFQERQNLGGSPEPQGLEVLQYNWEWPVSVAWSIIILVAILLLFITERKLGTLGVLLLGLLGFLIMTMIIAPIGASAPWGGLNWGRVLNLSTGYLTFFLLGITLLIGPLARIFQVRPFTSLVKHRRNIGVLVFVTALIHFILVLTSFYEANPIRWVEWYFRTGSFNIGGDHGISMVLGFISLVLFFLLAITSNKWSMRKMGVWWKHFQRLTYVTFILVVIHIFLFRLVLVNSAIFKTVFWTSVWVVVGLQLIGVIATIVRKRRILEASVVTSEVPTV